MCDRLSEDDLKRLRRAIPVAGNDPRGEEVHAEGFQLAVAMLEAAAGLGYDIDTQLLSTVSGAAYRAAIFTERPGVRGMSGEARELG